MTHRSDHESFPDKAGTHRESIPGSPFLIRSVGSLLITLGLVLNLGCTALPEIDEHGEGDDEQHLIEHIPGTDDEGGCSVVPIAAEEGALVQKNRTHAADGPPLVVFLNRHGGTYAPGRNNSATNRSSIVRRTRRVPAFERGDDTWSRLVSCVSDNFSRFNVQVTDVEPRAGAYIEVVVGGRPGDIGVGQGVGGIAPIDKNSCQPIETAIAFVFSRNLGSEAHLCKVTTHEIGHTLSLEHEYLCEDPMTYLGGCGKKSFQDREASCGTFSRERCQCRGGRQNTVQALYDLVGPQSGVALPSPEDDLVPPVIIMAEPENGATFPEDSVIDIRAEVTDDTRVARVELVWDYNGQRYACPSTGQYVDCIKDGDQYRWTVRVSSGQRSFRIRALDHFGKETESNSRTVYLTPDGHRPPALDDGVPPTITLLTPDADARFETGSQVIVDASITDNIGLDTVHLLWAFNGESYPCPTDTRSVQCRIAGDRYRWSIQVGSAGPRAFQIKARDRASLETITPEVNILIAEPAATPQTSERPGAAGDDEPEPEAPRPPNRPEGPAPSDESPNPLTGRPIIEVLSPRRGSEFQTNSQVEVVAIINGDVPVRDAHLIWHYNGERYACPTNGPYVTCRVNGERYTWTVALGSAAERPFQVTAQNTDNRRTTTPRRLVQVRQPGAGIEPTIAQLEPAPDAVWAENSQVRVVARVSDGALDDLRLVWAFNDNEYACPRQGRYVDCTRDGNTYTWLIEVGTGSRTFHLSAFDSAGTQITTPSQTIRLGN